MTNVLLRGSFWMLGMRWAMRCMGLFSTLVLARLLTPEDFGLVAMAMTVAGLLQLIAWTGVDLAVIQNPHATTDHYNTAWTVQIIQGMLVAVLLVVAAPLAAHYFNDPRVTTILWAIALQPLVEGFENIGIVAFRKDLEFHKDFRFGVIKKLFSVAVVIASALVMRNYWALVIGQVAGACIGVALSYWVHPFRPRLNLREVGAIWSFSQWMLLSRIGAFLTQDIDKFIVASTAGTTSMGNYHVAKELATLFTNELVFPIRRSLFPNLAQISRDPATMRNNVIALVSLVSTACFAIGMGLSAVAEDFVLLLLGSQWTSAIVLVRWLALFGAVYGIGMAVEIVLHARNQGKLAVMEVWARVVVLAIALSVVAGEGDLSYLAMTRTLIAVVFLPILLFLVARVTALHLVELLRVMARPLLAGTAMWLLLESYDLDLGAHALNLLLDVPVGAVTYIAVLLGGWYLQGRPPGPEQIAMDWLTRRLRPGVEIP